jgi:hypothetical protein
MDNYERGLFNMIAGSRADESSTESPLLTYFQPLTPGSSRDFENTGTCCGGTGMESHTKYQETVYLRSADDSTLWVNLYVPSQLNWADKGFVVKQETKFPRDDTVKFTVTGNGPMDIKLRVPAWIRKGFQVTLNNDPISDTAAEPGTYLTLSRTWASGDIIEVRMPFALRIERALDRPDTQALLWGPILLQTMGTPPRSQTYHQLSLYRHLKLDGDYARAAAVQSSPTGDSIFTFAGSDGNLTARPYYIGDTQAASAYFRRVEPNVVFGALDTKIANRKRNDGLPHYDVPVTNVTSPGNDGPTFLDVLWDSAPFETHEAFVGTVKEVVKSFVERAVFTQQEGEKIVKGASDAKEELEG